MWGKCHSVFQSDYPLLGSLTQIQELMFCCEFFDVLNKEFFTNINILDDILLDTLNILNQNEVTGKHHDGEKRDIDSFENVDNGMRVRRKSRASLELVVSQTQCLRKNECKTQNYVLDSHSPIHIVSISCIRGLKKNKINKMNA